MLTVPITDQSEVVLNPPNLWIEHYVQLDIFDTHLDAICCMQSGVSHGFNTEAVRSLAELHIEHGFLTHDEADAFLSDIPVPGEHDEPQSNVADYMTCSESQSRAFKWVESQLAAGKQIRAAINWTCWNWKILSSSWPN